VGFRTLVDKQEIGRAREALIWVKDQGIGIAPNEIPYIFDRFYRASLLDQSLSGFGIGLYIVKEIINRHGGRVWVESVKGAGSTFYIWLPLKAAHM
jgi:two-component system sensor histidine kinase VicK